jgi:hypothetical protein
MPFPVSWSIEDLGPTIGLLDASIQIEADVVAVNDRGDVACTASVAHPPPGPGSTSHAVLIRGTSVEDIHPAGAEASRAWDLNNAGFIVGGVSVIGTNHACIRDPAGTMSLLKPFQSDTDGEAVGISESGVVTGSSSTIHRPDHVLQWGPPVPSAATEPVDIGDPSFASIECHAINDAGQVAGLVLPAAGPPWVYGLRSAGEWTVVDPAGTNDFTADINASGVVSGTLQLALWPTGFVYEAGMRTLIDSNGWNFTTGLRSIADTGMAVGSALRPTPSSPDTNPFVGIVWDRAHGVRDLNTLIPPNTGWFITSAEAVSPSGAFIVGYGTLNGLKRIYRIARTPADAKLEFVFPVPEVAQLWPWLILGAVRADGGGIVVGPHGPVPDPRKGMRVVHSVNEGIADVTRTLAVHEIVGFLTDPDLRRTIQPALLDAAIERLRSLKGQVEIKGAIRNVNVVKNPSVIVGLPSK